MKYLKSIVLLIPALLSGCATGTKISSEQRASISSIAVEYSQNESSLSVEYRVKDSSAVASSAGVLGLIAAHVMDAPKNRNFKMESLIRARAFNQLIGSFSSADELTRDLNTNLKQVGYQVEADARTILSTQVSNCLSEDTRTLQVYTEYKLTNYSGEPLLQNSVRVQHSVDVSWNKKKLQNARRSAVQETARLIASDIAGRMVLGDKSPAPHIQGSRVFTRAVFPVDSPSSDTYRRSKDYSGYLVSTTAEFEDMRIRLFYGHAGNCN